MEYTSKIGMGIDIFVDVAPEEIDSVAEVVDILSRIDQYERVANCKAGVGLLQSSVTPGYRIVAEKIAIPDVEAGCARPNGKVEWYVEFRPRKYFEDLKTCLQEQVQHQ